jgi:hypothetical protein
MLPAGAEQITAKAIVGDDWAEVSFEYADDVGNIGSFTMPTPVYCHPRRWVSSR